MYHKTQGIVLSSTKYNDRFAITQIFTSDFGRIGYLLPQSKSRKSKINPALFFPLSVIDLEVEHFPLRQIHRIKEAQRLFPLYSLNVNIVKLSFAFFLSEFLAKVLYETSENQLIFRYIKESILLLETKERGLANFHLVFMFQLAQFLGVSPNLEDYKTGAYFDLMKGEFAISQPVHNHYANSEQSSFLLHFKRINYHNMHLFQLSQNDRNSLINLMLDYYRIHVYDFPELKSLEVLREMF